jgi:hypothetical protein
MKSEYAGGVYRPGTEVFKRRRVLLSSVHFPASQVEVRNVLLLSCHVRPDVSLTSADVRPQVT